MKLPLIALVKWLNCLQGRAPYQSIEEDEDDDAFGYDGCGDASVLFRRAYVNECADIFLFPAREQLFLK